MLQLYVSTAKYTMYVTGILTLSRRKLAGCSLLPSRNAAKVQRYKATLTALCVNMVYLGILKMSRK